MCVAAFDLLIAIEHYSDNIGRDGCTPESFVAAVAAAEDRDPVAARVGVAMLITDAQLGCLRVCLAQAAALARARTPADVAIAAAALRDVLFAVLYHAGLGVDADAPDMLFALAKHPHPPAWLPESQQQRISAAVRAFSDSVCAAHRLVHAMP